MKLVHFSRKAGEPSSRDQDEDKEKRQRLRLLDEAPRTEQDAYFGPAGGIFDED